MIKLAVPYRSQLDNAINPYGSCNVTSLAMGMLYYGMPETSQQQLEDEIYRYCLANGYSRHSPYDLAVVFEAFTKKYHNPCFDNFSVWGTVANIKKHLDGGHPVITHGYWTNFGHILVIVGYNKDGFIVHDPYGEWFHGGYMLNNPYKPELGKYLTYSYSMMMQKCLDNSGTWWVHYLSGDVPKYTNIDMLKPSLSGARLQDIYEKDSVFEFNVSLQINPGLVRQIQWCLKNHLQLSITVDGILGNQTESVYKSAMGNVGLPTDVVAKGNAKLLIEGVR